MTDSERPLAEQLARQILRDSHELEWLKPLAREYLKEITEPPLADLCGEQGRVVGLRESGPA